MQNYPKLQFSSLEELKEYAAYWIDKLRLQDWIIGFELCDEVYDDYDELCSGHSQYESAIKNAHIRIAKNPCGEDLAPCRFCAEKTLVHELLHLIYSPLYIEGTASYEAKIAELHEHQQVEFMARTLICVKYDLPFTFFDKSKYDTQEVKG